MSLSTPIFTVTCCACAVPHARAALNTARPNSRFIAISSLVSVRSGKRGRSPADQRAVAVLERTEGFVRRNRSAQLVEVAGIFRLTGLLHLEQIGRVQLAAVGADRALAEQRIVGWQLLHLGDHGGSICRALERRDRLEIVQRA